MSLNEIFEAIINDGYKKISKHSLKRSIHTPLQSGVIKRIRYGYYIHADFYTKNTEASLQSIKPANPATSERQTYQINSKVSSPATDKQEPQLLQPINQDLSNKTSQNKNLALANTSA